MKPISPHVGPRIAAAAWEILALVAVVAALVVGGRFLLASESAADAHAVTVKRMETVIEALTKYAVDNGGVFPGSKLGLRALLEEPTERRPVNWRGPYLKDATALRDAWGRDFRYVAPGAGNPARPYDLWSLGAEGREGGQLQDTDILSWDKTTWLPPRP
ncbi:MAG TPA: type II secretion system protein GspG [Armatimonadota bacterium]|jgi:general secretion pathway protein G